MVGWLPLMSVSLTHFNLQPIARSRPCRDIFPCVLGTATVAGRKSRIAARKQLPASSRSA